jgi:HAD superfamily hydrolase (TIGR01509 family)
LGELRTRDTCIIFDCDGVLVDSEHIKSEAVARHLAELGISISGPALLERFSGVPAAEMFRVLALDTGVLIPPSHVEEAQEIKLARCAAVGDALAMPGVHECLAMLRGIPVCVASSSSPTMLAGLLRQARLWDRFAPNIFSVAHVTRGKPAPDLFLFAAQRMRVPPERCVVVEDSVAGVQAAKAASMIAIGFAGGSHCRPDQADKLRQAGAEKVFMNMASLSEYLATVFDRRAVAS